MPVGTGQFQIRLVERLAVHHEFSVLKMNLFARQTDDAFHECHVYAGKADDDDIAALRFAMEVGEAVEKIEAAVAERGNHALAVDLHRPGHEIENDKSDGAQCDDGDKADERPFRLSSDDDGLDR